MNTATVSLAVTPTVLSTFLSHYLNRKPLRERPTAHLSYDEGLHLVRSFLTFASHHTVEDLQAFTAQWVPHPQWVKVEEVEIPEEKLLESAATIQEQLGPDGVRKVGGKNWWQWRRPESPLKAEWIEMRSDYNARKKAGDPGKRVMLYVHGGAYFFGSVDEHRYQMQRHARKLKARVLAPKYRLSPQFPFPCGLQDCLAAYLYLLKTQDPSTILLAGDSAGGGMVMSMLITIRDRGIPMPAGAILISPWVDLTHSFPSVSGEAPLDYIPSNGFHHKPSPAWPPLNADEYLLLKTQIEKNTQPGHTKLMKPATVAHNHGAHDTTNGSATTSGVEHVPKGQAETTYLSCNIDGKEVYLKDQIQMYTTNELLSHPLISPVMQPTLGGLPPLLIMVGGGEFLRDEQIYLAHKCADPAKYAPADINMTDFGREQLARFKPTDVQLQVWDDLCHVAPTLSFTRPAKYMFRSIAQFGAWVLARAQKTGIEIMDDDQISTISASGSDDASERTRSIKDGGPTEAGHTEVGKAGDALPPFENHMIRQKVSRHGIISHLSPAEELDACKMLPAEIGIVKEGPVRKWLEARSQFDARFASARAKIHKRRLKEMMAGYEGFDGETPPPSALAARRKAGYAKAEKKKRKSMGLAMWSLWGSKHDEVTVHKEQRADQTPEVKVAVPEEGQNARSPSDLERQERDVAERPKPSARRSRSRTKIVKDEQQTEDTPIASLMAMREAKQGDEGNGMLTPSYVPTGAAGKRPIVGGIAVPFSLGKEADTASMITLTSTMDQLSMRVASPTPTHLDGVPPTSAEVVAEKNPEAGDEIVEPEDVKRESVVTPEPTSPMTVNDASVRGDETPMGVSPLTTPATEAGINGILVGGSGEPTRPPMETFFTAQEDLPRAK